MGFTKRLSMIAIVAMLALMPAGITPTHDPDAGVFSALLSEFCKSKDTAGKVVSDRPLANEAVSKATGYVSGILGEDFPRSPTSSADWPHFAPCRNVRVVDASAVAIARELNIRPGMSTFYVRFHGAHGLLLFSRPAYNVDGKRALVYEVLQCGPMCGFGGLVELAREDGAWKIAKYHAHWIS